jgi:NADH dehydrogenase/NADH:ubiquinone oxidoreductase subunit G
MEVHRETTPFEIINGHNNIIYEPGKCISCGICVKITEMHGERLGLAFIGRGFDVKVAVPFDKSLTEGISKTAREAVMACPTGHWPLSLFKFALSALNIKLIYSTLPECKPCNHQPDKAEHCQEIEEAFRV